MLNEAKIDVLDRQTREKMLSRANEAARVAKEAENAANIAEQNGNSSLAASLRSEANRLNKLATTLNLDDLTDDDSSANKSKNNSENKSPNDDKNNSDDSEKSLDNDNNKSNKDAKDNNTDEADNKAKSDTNGTNTDKDSQNSDNQQQIKDENEDKDAENSDSNEDETDDVNKDSSNSSNKDNNNSSKNKTNLSSSSKDSESNDDSNEDSDSDSDDSDDSEEQDEESDNENNNAEQNPFDETQSMSQSQSQSQQEQKTLDIEKIKEILKNLDTESKSGAKDAINKLINDKKASLEEQFLSESQKQIIDYSDDEWDAEINSILDKINAVQPLKKQVDTKTKVDLINKMVNDPIVKKNLEKEIEDDANKEIAEIERKKREREENSARYRNLPSIESFKIDFYECIKDQVDEVKRINRTYNEINTEYEDDGIVFKGEQTKNYPDEVKPIVSLFFDRSGSWNDYDKKIGDSIVATIQEFVDSGDIVLNIYYFDNIVTTDLYHPSLGHGSTGAWYSILSKIESTKAKNIVLMTDDDMERDAVRSNQLTVDGVVWFIWKNGERAASAPKKLRGELGTYEYQFN